MNKTRVAGIMVGLPGHGHSIAFAPAAIISIIDALVKHFGDSVTCRVFDEIRLGHQGTNEQVAEFDPDAVLISVPVSGYYASAVEFATYWANTRGRSVLLGGYHFNVPGSGIAIMAAKRLRLPVCIGEGRLAAIGFVEALQQNRSLASVPNIVYPNEQGGILKTATETLAVEQEPLSTPPLDVFDPRPYWGRVSEVDELSALEIGRTVIGPNVVRGCTYRASRIAAGKTACNYCTLTGQTSAVDGSRFWRLMREMYDHVISLPWEGAPGIMCYHVGDDMGSNMKLIRDIEATMPEWAKLDDCLLRHRMYAWHVSTPEHAQMLRRIGVRWVYIGADGKQGFTHDWSDSNPLVRSLRNCRTERLAVRISYVLGQPGQSWADIDAWQRFNDRIRQEFRETSLVTQGWVNIVAPGSPNWEALCRRHPFFRQSDFIDLDAAQTLFVRDFTGLCGDRDPHSVLRELYARGETFDSNKHSPFVRGC